MATERRDEEYGYRTLVRVLTLTFSLMFLGVFLIPTVVDPPHITTAGYVLLGGWILVLISGVVWCGRTRAAYHCPRCGARLPPLRGDAATRYEHRFRCPSCDVIWTTGVYEGDS